MLITAHDWLAVLLSREEFFEMLYNMFLYIFSWAFIHPALATHRVGNDTLIDYPLMRTASTRSLQLSHGRTGKVSSL